jgi:hypothetical protein
MAETKNEQQPPQFQVVLAREGLLTTDAGLLQPSLM